MEKHSIGEISNELLPFLGYLNYFITNQKLGIKNNLLLTKKTLVYFFQRRRNLNRDLYCIRLNIVSKITNEISL